MTIEPIGPGLGTEGLGTLILFDENLYRTGHMANRWMNLLVAHFIRNARLAAPMRTGELRAGLHGDVDASPMTKTMIGTIASEAPHTMYVIAGTHGPIYSNLAWAAGGNIAYAFVGRGSGGAVVGRKGFWLGVGNRAWPPVTPKHSVSGQEANNFLFTAWRRTSHQHSVLRGVLPEVIQHL